MKKHILGLALLLTCAQGAYAENPLEKLGNAVANEANQAVVAVEQKINNTLGINQEAMKVVPESADFVFKINLSKIMAMPSTVKQIEENFAKNPEQKKTFDEIKAKTGFDVYKDLNSVVVFASSKVAQSGMQDALAGAIFEGKFDPSKICEVIKADEKATKDVEVTVVDGYNTILPKDKKEGCGVFLNNNLLVTGSMPGADAVKSVFAGKAKSVESRKDFFSVISKLDSKATVTGAGIFPEEFKANMKQNPQAEALSALNYFFFDLSNDDNLVLNFNAEVDDEKNVEKVETSINGFVAMVKMLAAQSPEASQIVNALAVSKEGKTVKLNLNVPAEQMKKIMEALEAKAKQMQNNGGADANAPRE